MLSVLPLLVAGHVPANGEVDPSGELREIHPLAFVSMDIESLPKTREGIPKVLITRC